MLSPESVTSSSNRMKTKLIHFLRHAHGYHNEAGEIDRSQYLREDLEDAEISELGRSQCRDFCDEISKSTSMNNASLLVVSPMRRTLQTARLCFPHMVGKVPWIALECVREQTGLHPCDRRLPISHLSSYCDIVDFGEITQDRDPLYHLYDEREPADDLEKRAREFVRWIENRSESEIIVVSHSAFLRVLFARVLEPGDSQQFVRFQNCEMRTYRMNTVV